MRITKDVIEQFDSKSKPSYLVINPMVVDELYYDRRLKNNSHLFALKRVAGLMEAEIWRKVRIANRIRSHFNHKFSVLFSWVTTVIFDKETNL